MSLYAAAAAAGMTLPIPQHWSRKKVIWIFGVAPLACFIMAMIGIGLAVKLNSSPSTPHALEIQVDGFISTDCSTGHVNTAIISRTLNDPPRSQSWDDSPFKSFHYKIPDTADDKRKSPPLGK